MQLTTRAKRPFRNDRGSALLVSLMVIVGLSLLGLGFVAISETETAIAKNQLSVTQTQAVAEAGAKLVVEWFQDPAWGQTNAGLPANPGPAGAIKTVREWTGGSNAYKGVYKPDASIRLLEKPYRPQPDNRFYGDENSADLIINRTTDPTTIDSVNTLLLGPNPEDLRDGEITEIKVFAPPIVGGALTTNGVKTNADGTPQRFWVGGERFGVATIKVTATMFRDRTLTGAARIAGSNVLATHAVRLVIGEIPLPIPGGPIQSNTSISFGGDFVVHWGNETAITSLTNKRNPTSLPWANAYERPHFEHGYEPGQSIAQIQLTSGGSGYTSVPVVTIVGGGGAGATAVATVTAGVVTAVTVTARGTGYSTSSQPTITFVGGGGSGASAIPIVAAEVWPASGGQYDNANYFNEILNKSFEDVWFGSRAGGDNSIDGVTPPGVNPQCYPYAISANEAAAPGSYFFQWQTKNSYPLFKKVLFPTIKYDFWKRIASQGRGYKGIYYFKFDKAAGAGYKKGGVGATNPEYYWVNVSAAGTGAQLGPGVYFFDTIDGINPQTSSATRLAQLTPPEAWNSNKFGAGTKFLMEGFIYTNNSSWGTTGVGGSATTVDANFPGEPYRDLGYPVWDPVARDWDRSCAGAICNRGAGDGSFSYQDLNGNGKFDVVTMPAPAWNSNDPGVVGHAAGSTYIVKTWKSDPQAIADYGQKCTAPAVGYDGTNPAPSDCSEPHEPYLNLIYPNAAATSVTVGWQAPAAQTFLKKKAGVTCTAASPQTDCTSNAYDLDGAQVPIDVILSGIFYNEGDYASTGNVAYYGSLLIQGNVSGSGTPDIWFDEKLIKGTWAPPNFPRVIVYNEQTDEEQQ